MRRLDSFRSDFLFPDNDFRKGMGSVLNIGGGYFQYSYSNSGIEADIRAIANDWGVVGNDMRKSIDNIHQKLTEQGHQLEFDFTL